MSTNPEGFKRMRSMSEALKITPSDMAGPVLVVLGTIHRKQQKEVFATQGLVGAGGIFAPLSLRYAERKKKVVGRKEILQLTGDLKRRFTERGNSNYIQRVTPAGKEWLFQFGAVSDIAAAHLLGNPDIAGSPRSILSRKVFGGTAPRLPVRDLINKTDKQVVELEQGFVLWYRKQRIPQVLRHHNPKLRNSRPGGIA